MENLLTPEELAELWKVKKSWIYDEVQAKRLKCARLGKQLRFRESDLQQYLDSKAAA